MISVKGSIQEIERKKGTVYRAYFDLPSSRDRNRVTESFQEWKYDDAEARAEQFLVTWNYRIHQGDYVRESDLTSEQYFRAWHQRNKDELAHSTVQKREYALDEIISEIGDMPLSELNTFHLQDLYRTKIKAGLSPNTVKTFHSILANALKEASQNDLIDKLPTRSIEPPSGSDKEIVVLGESQLKDLLDAIQEHERKYSHQIDLPQYPIFYLAATTGMRMGEILGLKWDDVNLDQSELAVRRSLKKGEDGLFVGDPKNESSFRKIVLTKKCVRVLKKHRQRFLQHRMAADEWKGNKVVFCTGTGRLIWPSNIRRRLNKALEDLEIPEVTFHGLRHTHATLMLTSGVHPKIVSERLGHSSIEITLDRYSHVLPSIQREGVSKFENKTAI